MKKGFSFGIAKGRNGGKVADILYDYIPKTKVLIQHI